MPEDRVAAFRQSMKLDYEKWHEGIGYEIGLFKSATPTELAQMERLVLAAGVDDWRDIEALNALGTPTARARIRETLESGSLKMRMAVLSHAPDLVSDAEREAVLIAVLGQLDFYEGLTQALSIIEDFHPAPIIDALFRETLRRDGGAACHFSAMLMFLHGKAKYAFDWVQRPFFLRFNTEDRGERVAVFEELCAKLGVDPATWHDKKS